MNAKVFDAIVIGGRSVGVTLSDVMLLRPDDVVGSVFDETGHTWMLQTRAGDSYRASVVIARRIDVGLPPTSPLHCRRRFIVVLIIVADVADTAPAVIVRWTMGRWPASHTRDDTAASRLESPLCSTQRSMHRARPRAFP